MLSNNGHSLRLRVTIFSNSSIIPPGFKFTQLPILLYPPVLMRSCSVWGPKLLPKIHPVAWELKLGWVADLILVYSIASVCVSSATTSCDYSILHSCCQRLIAQVWIYSLLTAEKSGQIHGNESSKRQWFCFEVMMLVEWLWLGRADRTDATFLSNDHKARKPLVA